MKAKSFAVAVCLSFATATTALAAPINLHFGSGGSVFGTLYGLDDADGTYSASSYDLNVPFGGSWTGVSALGLVRNTFTFSSGSLVSYDFEDTRPIMEDANQTTLLSFELVRATSGVDLVRTTVVGLGLTQQPNITFSISPVAAVPLPAGGLLLFTALGGVAALKRRKKCAA